jgi:hypothetical protein
MRRTNVYLSEREQAALDARARIEGSTRSDVLRAILDDGRRWPAVMEAESVDFAALRVS